MNKDIDFVVTWVDGNDEEWKKEKFKYKNQEKDVFVNQNNVRFRDWDNLQYWFRGIEKFTPWVRKIHFVTYGHLPKWLNTKNKKLNIVNHEDYIPKQYLPTFSSIGIELNLHRIKELSENFVYFNDDMFIINHMAPKDFFKNDLPCDSAILNAQISFRGSNSNAVTNNMEIINDYFDKEKCFKKNFLKYYNINYGKDNLRTLFLSQYSKFPGFLETHLPISYKKSIFEEVWKKEFSVLNQTCYNKFRTKEDVNHWLFRDWQLAKGSFSSRTKKIGKYFTLSDDNSNICNCILKQKYKMICINDNSDIINFNQQKEIIKNSFNKILPEKSSFEI